MGESVAGANPHTAEVNIDAVLESRGADDAVVRTPRRYKFRLSCNDLCSLQAHWGMTGKDPEFLARFDLMAGLTDLRDVLFFGLRRYQREMTVEEAGDVMDALGYNATRLKVQEAIRCLFPEPSKDDGVGKEPPRPSTGRSSTRAATAPVSSRPASMT